MTPACSAYLGRLASDHAARARLVEVFLTTADLLDGVSPLSPPTVPSDTVPAAMALARELREAAALLCDHARVIGDAGDAQCRYCGTRTGTW